MKVLDEVEFRISRWCSRLASPTDITAPDVRHISPDRRLFSIRRHPRNGEGQRSKDEAGDETLSIELQSFFLPSQIRR